jgi:dTDP-4-amino-4,6-dideoxygalactose transaminase
LRDTFLPLATPVIGDDEIAEVIDSLRSGWITSGPKVKRFERMLEEYTGAAHMRCVSSCTAALTLAMRTAGLGPGDEVIVPAMTFVATANAVEDVGATPVIVDVEPGTGNIDVAAVRAAITPRTRAVVPVHYAGRPVDLDSINALRDEFGLVVIEDAAHALGASWRGQRIGSHGNLAAFSFYATKNITTAEGGALSTPCPETAAEVERLALHGLSVGAWQRYGETGFRHFEVMSPGYKANMTDLSASIGLHQLPKLDAWIDRRAGLAARYDELLAGLPVQTPPPTDPRARHAVHLYPVLVDPECGVARDAVLDGLLERRIGTGVHYRGVHLHPYYRTRYGIDPASLPVATDMSQRTLSLPLCPSVTEADQDDVVEALSAVLAHRPAAIA